MVTSHKIGQNDAWEGVVTDKSRGLLDGSNLYHVAEIRLADGATTRFRIGRRLWKSLAVGDRVVKRPGEDPVRG
ncbi:hypothetical protein VSR01_31535 [Actinacidiphila sp. DG2A-62]|jgi:hypothetical protein|uniref:DUF7489 domain-containing protein n=1 Tax=Actinacidiphila sp. DG2A-62 TaxID=3108821 RepID=UPI002DBD3499|nr:hypothetical protein [Actinacidiphila sp. DG2A-62]MEC3997779.1 hypothetical protein [Actinacidiphila sp. DG2A-62]